MPVLMLTNASVGSAPVHIQAPSHVPKGEPDRTFEFEAFLSYSHAADGALAPAVQAGLQQFARPWNRLRAIRIFRDKTGMSANPGLWSTITAALNSSRYFLLLASPAAAGSHWVNKEVEHWLDARSPGHMLIVLTDGEIAWDPTANDFDWNRTSALPSAVRGTFSEEPLWVDLRFAQHDEHLSLNNPAFREAVADLSSVLRGIPKDQLIGEDVRQHRKAVVFRRSVMAGLAALTIAAGAAALVAVKQSNLARRNEAQARQNEQLARTNAELAKSNEQVARKNEELARSNEKRAIQGESDARREARIALARQFAAQANDQFQKGNLVTSHALAIESLRASDTFQGRRALFNVLELIPPKPEIIPGTSGRPVDAVAFSPDGHWIARGDRAGRIVVSDLSRARGDIVSDSRRPSISSMAFSPDGRWVAAGVNGGVWLLDIEAGRALQETPIATSGHVWSLVFSPDSRHLVVAEGGANPRAGRIGVLRSASGHWQEMDMPAGKDESLQGNAALFIDDGTLVVVRSNGLSFVSFPALQELSFLSLGEAHGVEAPEDAGCRSAALSERPDILPNLRLLFVGCKGSIDIVRLPGRDFPTNSYDSLPFATSDPAHLSFSSNHKYIAAMAQLGDAIKVYGEGTEVFRTNRPSPTGFGTPSFAFQPDADVLAAGLQDGSTAMWHLSKGLSSLRWPRRSRVSSLSFSPDQKWLATVSYRDGILNIISTSDITNGKPRYTFQLGTDLTKPSFSPDGRFVLVADKHSIHLLQTSPWTRLTRYEIAGEYFQAAFSPDSRMLAASDANGIHRFDTATWQEKPLIKGRFPSGFRFSPDGRWLAAFVDNRSTRDGSVAVHVWSSVTGEEIASRETFEVPGQLRKPPRLRGSQSLIADAERWPTSPEMFSHGEGVSPDGRWKLGHGKTSSSMELTQVGSGVAGVLFHDASINDAGFSFDGRWLMTSTADDAVHIWPLLVPDFLAEACKLLPRNLTREEWKTFGMEGDYRKTCPDLSGP